MILQRNILFFIYRLYGGGAERVVSNLSMALGDNYNIKIIIYDLEEKTYPYKGELIRIKLPFSKNPVHNNSIQRTIRFFMLITKLRKLKRDNKIDISVSFGEQANIINVLSKKKEHIYLSMRTTLSKEMQNRPKKRILTGLIKRLYNRAEAIVVPSALAASDLEQSFDVRKNKLEIIHNYVDSVAINKLSDEPISDTELFSLFRQKILLNVGRITPAKGQWLLLHLFKKLKERIPEARLVIIGEGESERHFKMKLVNYAAKLDLKLYDRTAADKFSLDHDVFLLGFDSNPFKYMKQSQLLVFSSTFEGFPNTIIEAMQSGLPVIAADCQSGPREIIAPDTDPSKHTSITEFHCSGVLAPSLPTSSIDDPVDDSIMIEWENAIITLLDNQELRNKYIQNGIERATAFEKEIILKKWESLLQLES